MVLLKTQKKPTRQDTALGEGEVVYSVEGETESEGERECAAEKLGETEAVEVVVGVGRCVAEGRAVGE